MQGGVNRGGRSRRRLKNAQLTDAPLKRRGSPPPSPPGGRRADQNQGMKKSAQCATVCVKQNNQTHKEADKMKCSKSGSHITYEDRLEIQKVWNTPDHQPHLSVREAAKILHLSEATLRRELKRGCAGGKYCMQLNDGPEIRWQYFPYCADKAMQDAREKASHKGRR